MHIVLAASSWKALVLPAASGVATDIKWKRTENGELKIFDVTTCQNLSKLFRQLIAAVPGARVPSLRRAAT
jgi:hypothetical protein